MVLALQLMDFNILYYLDIRNLLGYVVSDNNQLIGKVRGFFFGFIFFSIVIWFTALECLVVHGVNKLLLLIWRKE